MRWKFCGFEKLLLLIRETPVLIGRSALEKAYRR
jgi:hypothetical protein